MSVEIDIQYQGDLRCTATHRLSGMTLTTDAPLDNGGKGEAFSPTDLVATALGTCIITIMALAAQHSGIDLAGTRVRVVKEMANAPLRRIGELKVTVTFPKTLKLSEAERAKLEKVVNQCPVKQSLHPDVKVKAEFVYPV